MNILIKFLIPVVIIIYPSQMISNNVHNESMHIYQNDKTLYTYKMYSTQSY